MAYCLNGTGACTTAFIVCAFSLHVAGVAWSLCISQVDGSPLRWHDWKVAWVLEPFWGRAARGIASALLRCVEMLANAGQFGQVPPVRDHVLRDAMIANNVAQCDSANTDTPV